MSSKLKLGFIGCGRISGKHFDALKALKQDIELVAVCDTNKVKATVAEELWGCKSYTSVSDMMDAQDLDIVTIATPNGLHCDHIKEVARPGLKIITEKPLGISLENGMSAVEYCKEVGAELFVVHQNRFNQPVQALWEALKNGYFGKVYLISANVFWTRPQAYYDKEGDWHGTKNLDGGAFYTQASHYIDLMQWLAGSPVTMVSSQLRTLARDIETEDTGVAHIEWSNGIIGSINMTMLTYPKNLEGSITVFGENGTVKIGGIALNKVEHVSFENEKAIEIFNSIESYETDSVYGFGHQNYYQDIIDSIKAKEQPLVTSAEGIKSLKILEGIVKSSQIKKPVFFEDTK